MTCEEIVHITSGPSWHQFVDNFKYSYLGEVIPAWFTTITGDEISLRISSMSIGHFMGFFGKVESQKVSFEGIIISETDEIQGFSHFGDTSPLFAGGWYNPHAREGEIWVYTEPS